MTTESRFEDGIVKRHGKRGVTYCVRYRVGSQSRRKAFRTAKEARAFLAETKASVLTGTFIEPAHRELTMRDWAKTYNASRPWQESTREHNVCLTAKHILPSFGDMPLGAIRPIDVQNWITKLEAKGLKPNSIDSLYNVLRAMFNEARHNGMIASSPCSSRIVRPEIDRSIRNVLSEQQVVAIANGLDERYRILVWLGAMGGLRLGEALGLTLDRVDFEGRRLVIAQQQRRNGTLTKRTKNGKVRYVPVSDALLARIRAHVAAHGLGPDGRLLSAPLGGVVYHANFYGKWAKAIDGLTLAEDCDTFHALRHHAASTLIAAGRNAKVVQAFLGHATIRQTMDTYVHLFPSDDDETRDVFEGRYETTLAVAS